MTAVRRPVLACDAPGCTTAIWTMDAWTIPEMRARARERGWRVHDRRDWCPRHATALGLGVSA